MGYEVLIQTLLKEGENKSREIIEKARAESEAILREAKERACRLEQENRERLQKEIQARRAGILNRARIEGRGILLEAKHAVLDRVFERAKERLHDLLKQAGCGDPTRHIWTRLVEESLPEGRPAGLKAILHEGAPHDLEEILRVREVGCERVNDPDLWFGFRLVSSGGEMVVTNSYKARLEKVRPDLLVELNALLFGEQDKMRSRHG
jgi:vacuolar-type H+-ATPase subunit E/Vma4